MILFRADGNPKIGSGHIMRCLSLACAFRMQGQESIFLTADHWFQPLIQNQGFRCIVLNGRYNHMDRELSALIPILGENLPDGLVLDSYFVTPSYMKALQNLVPLIYIDDLNAFDYPADIIINYGLFAEKMRYPQGKTYLLGPQYAPLRQEFFEMRRRVPGKKVRRVLLSTGGGDPEHVVLACVQYLQNRANGIAFHVVLGAMNKDVAEIERTAQKMPHVILHKSVTYMGALMQLCDAAIAAAGTTLYELCACGLPTVTYALSDNQVEGAAAFEAAGLMLNAGDVRSQKCFMDNLFAKLDELERNWPLRKSMAEKMQTLIDGSGAMRLAKEIRRLMEKIG